jgi:hypothetical protein
MVNARTLRLLQGAFLLTLSVAALPGLGVAQCLSDTTNTPVKNLLGYVRLMMTSTDTAITNTRDLAYHLPAVPVAQVSIVSDTHTCGRALTAVNRDPSNAHLAAATNVIVVQAGTNFVVTDPSVRMGEWGVITVLDRNFKVLGRVVG